MNATPNPVLEGAWSAGFSPSAQALRQWAAPGIILAVTSLADEEILLFHAIRQARRSAAKVLLVHVLEPQNVPFDARGWIHRDGPGSSVESALASLQRMARQLRWVGIPCEPLLLRGLPAKEIPLVVKARGVDRLLMTGACGRHGRGEALKTLAEELLPRISVPICTVGQRLRKVTVSDQGSANITLALSLHSDAEMPLAFASRLAQELPAKLTVMHVIGSEEKNLKEIDRTPLAVASQIPADLLKETELLCPLEIVVRKGDPAAEILKFAGCTNQEFIVLGLVSRLQSVQAGSSSIVHRVISEARCPVIVLGQCLGRSAQG